MSRHNKAQDIGHHTRSTVYVANVFHTRYLIIYIIVLYCMTQVMSSTLDILCICCLSFCCIVNFHWLCMLFNEGPVWSTKSWIVCWVSTSHAIETRSSWLVSTVSTSPCYSVVFIMRHFNVYTQNRDVIYFICFVLCARCTACFTCSACSASLHRRWHL